MTAVYTITSGLHDESAVQKLSDAFLQSIFGPREYEFMGADFRSWGSHPLELIYVRTGGAEGIFKSLLPEMLARGTERYYLLTSGKSNSLAASLEILSYLQQQGLRGEVLHGSEEYIRGRICLLERVEAARAALKGMRMGVIGEPSDWLISSNVSTPVLADRLGVRLVPVPMEELLSEIPSSPATGTEIPEGTAPSVKEAFPGANQIYNALKVLVQKHSLGAFTLRCFDLLSTVGNTGCVALARFNSEGVPAACEGDVPALLSMMLCHELTGCTGFMANPARIDAESGEMLFAHCTIPFSMVRSWQADTHFESGIGVGIHGHFPEGPVTVFKLSPNLDRHFAAEGVLFANQYEDNLCRTQVRLRLSPEDARYFLTKPIGNHHIILPGHHAALLNEFLG